MSTLVEGNGVTRPAPEARPSLPLSGRKYTIFGLTILVGSLLGFGIWAAFAPLDGAVVAPGQVVVESNRKTVQHLHGGIVEDIYVRDGDTVEKGQPLLKLDPTDVEAELETVRIRLFTSLARAARLNAEMLGADTITFPEYLTSRMDNPDVNDVVTGQREFFRARRDSLAAELEARKTKIEQIDEQIDGLKALMASERSQIASMREEVEEWQSLLADQMTDKQRLREVQRQLDQLQGSLASHRAEVARLKVQQEETRTEILARQRKFREEAVDRLRDVQRDVLDARARLQALEKRVERMVVTAPTGGKVVGMSIHTIGGVIGPGDPILDIVPQTQELVIEARISPGDIDRVYEGLMADIRFSAFSSQTTHVIEGEVMTVSADTLKDERGETEYYLARVTITPQGLERMRDDGITLMPGMPAQVFVKTGERTFLEYLLKPVSNMFAQAFKEK
jgi:epimerase transport system membrane fusion protein